MLNENYRGRLSFGYATRPRVFALPDHRVALGGSQIEPETPIIVPPERLLKGSAVFGIAEHRRYQAPGLDRIGGDFITAAGNCVLPPGENKVADRFEIGHLASCSANGTGTRQLSANVFDRLVVAGRD
jgi:hypothetical protein